MADSEGCEKLSLYTPLRELTTRVKRARSSVEPVQVSIIGIMIVTTAIKAEAVRSLSDFMNVKGKFMHYRLDPTYADRHPTFYEDILAFVEKHTDIPENPFWFEMDMEQKLRFVKFLRFSGA